MSATPINARRRSPLVWVGMAAVPAAVLLVFLGSKFLRASHRDSASNGPTFVVQRGPLTINVSEAGTIKPRQVEIIKSEVEGQSQILYLIPEGTRVKKGDLLCELDSSKIQDQVVTQLITVQNAEAAHVAAREALEVARSQARSDIAKAELDLQFAKEDLDKYVRGDFPNQLRQAESKIAVAEEEVQRAAEKLRWSEVLFSEKYLSATELQADQVAHKKVKLDRELAKDALTLLKDFTDKRQMATFNANVDQMTMALDRVKRKASADVVQAEATLKAKELELQQQKDLLAKNQRIIEKARMYAPVDGLVVYATTSGGGFRGNNDPIAEGSTVRERQEIIHVPTADVVMAEIKVHESSLSKVRVGLPVRITVDAAQGEIFWGQIVKISQMPDQQSLWQNPDLKVYNTEIWLSGDTSRLRTGMTCRAEVIVEQHQDVVYLPVQAVVRVNGKSTVYALPAGEGGANATPQPREIELGLDNNRMAHVKGGVNAGEVVLLNPPLPEGSAAAAEQVVVTPTTMPVIAGPATRPAGAGGDARGAAGRGGSGRGGRGAGSGNLTPEQQAERVKRFQNMSPEEQAKAMEEFRRMREQGGGGRGGDADGEGGGAGSGRPRGAGGGRGASGPGGGAGAGGER